MDKPVLLITGVCGRLGAKAASLFSEKFQVVGLDVCTPENPIQGVEYLLTDISSLENVKDSLTEVRKKYGGQIVSVIHLAAYYNFEGGGWDKYEKITIGGTANLLEALEEFEVSQFVFSSTILVYAPCKLREKIDEDSPVDPKWEYPLSKIRTEELIHQKRGAMASVVLRIAGIYTDECNSVPISQHIIRIFEKKLESHFFPGNPHHGASFLHMDDMMQALKLLVEKRDALPKEELFVLGEPDLMSQADLQREIGILVHGKPWWTIRIPKWFAKLGVMLKGCLPFLKKSFIKTWMIDLADDHYDLDIKKAHEILGWQPVHSLRNTLPKMVEILKKHSTKWLQNHEF